MIRRVVKDQKGLTLTELLVVILILGILAALAMFAFKLFAENAGETALERDRDEIYTAASAFFSESVPNAFPVVEIEDTNPLILPDVDSGIRLIDFEALLPQDPSRSFVPDFLKEPPRSGTLTSWRISLNNGFVFFAPDDDPLELPEELFEDGDNGDGDGDGDDGGDGGDG